MPNPFALGIVGFFVGVGMGVIIYTVVTAFGGRMSGGLRFAVLVGLPLGIGLGMYLWGHFGVGGAGWLVDRLNFGGPSEPEREYSYAESLAARGHLEQAIQEYLRGSAEFPRDPEPHLRIARLLRDRMGRYEESVEHFRNACGAAAMDQGREWLTTREIVEVFDTKLGKPERAALDLARLYRKYRTEPAGKWAAGRLDKLGRRVPGH